MAFGLNLAPQKRVYAAFYVYSLALGGIYPRLGDIQLAMGIEEGALGAALIGAAIGTQISLMFSGPLLQRFGYRLALIVCIPMLALFMGIGTLSPTPVVFFFALMLAGLAIGAIEVMLNVEADRTEHMVGRRIMNRSHAFWSFGFFSAGMVGAFAKQLGLSPQVHLFGMVAIILVVTLALFGRFEPAPARTAGEGPQPRFVRPTLPIVILVGFTLSAMLLEGAGADWSAIFMRDVFSAAPFVNAFAFAIGAFSQAVARFFADGFVEKYGPLTVARVLILAMGVGVVLVTFSPAAWVALVGFALMGAGTSALFPLAISAAAQRTDRPAAVNVAAVAQMSFITFMIAPPLLGFVAEHFGIRISFGIGIPLVILSWFTVHVLRPAAAEGKTATANA